MATRKKAAKRRGTTRVTSAKSSSVDRPAVELNTTEDGTVLVHEPRFSVEEKRVQRGPDRGKLRVSMEVTLSDDYEYLLGMTMPTGAPDAIGYVGRFMMSAAMDALRLRAGEAVSRGLHKKQPKP